MDLEKNLSLKITAVAIAMGLWIWVAAQGDVVKTLQVPLVLGGLPADMDFAQEPPDSVSVRLRGSEIALRSLAPERVQLPVNLSSQVLELGTNLVTLDTRQVRVPAGIGVDRVTPSVIELKLERRTTREVPVQPEIRGEPAAGYEVAGTVVQPPRMLIEGPESAIKETEYVAIPAISIDGVNQNQRVRVRPFPMGPAGSRVRLANEAAQVDVAVFIRPITLERLISGVAVQVEAGEGGGQRPLPSPPAADVKVTGPREWVEALTADDLQVVIDPAALAGKPGDLPSTALSVRLRQRQGAPTAGVQLVVAAPDTIYLDWSAAARD